MPILDPHKKRAYTRSYQRATFALRERFPDEFAELLAIERAAALQEDTTVNLPPGPPPGAKMGRHYRVELAGEAGVRFELTIDEIDDLLAVLVEARRAHVPVRPGRWQSVTAVMQRLHTLAEAAVAMSPPAERAGRTARSKTPR